MYSNYNIFFRKIKVISMDELLKKIKLYFVIE